MQSKATEGVPHRVHAHHSRLIFFSLYLSSLMLVESSLVFFFFFFFFFFSVSPSAHVDLIYADYFIISIDHSCNPTESQRERAREKRIERDKEAGRKRARLAHSKGQLDRATRTIKE
jgi:hypothetical protein